MRTALRVGLLSGVLAGLLGVSVFGQEGTEPAADESREADFQAIRESSEKYVAAFNAADAQAIGQLYAEFAELVDSGGTIFRGREAITAEYEAFFERHPQASMRIVVEKVTLLGPTAVIEDGQAEIRLDADQPPAFSRYVAVHTKVDGQWRLASVRDHEAQGELADNLAQLSWMIGRWVDESPDSLMEIDCYWHESGAFLMREFEIKIEGLLASKGTERIGWDPLRKQVRSWLFDADGGYLEGAWVRQGNRWTVTTHGFRADGEPIEATYHVTPLRADAYHMHAVNRTVGREELDDFEMTIVHRAPTPGETPPVDATDSQPTPQERQE